MTTRPVTPAPSSSSSARPIPSLGDTSEEDPTDDAALVGGRVRRLDRVARRRRGPYGPEAEAVVVDAVVGRRQHSSHLSWTDARSPEPERNTTGASVGIMARAMPHEIRSFLDDGVSLSYEVFGKGDRTVVYLHGILLDSHLNHRLAEDLGRGRLPGHPARPSRPRPLRQAALDRAAPDGLLRPPGRAPARRARGRAGRGGWASRSAPTWPSSSPWSPPNGCSAWCSRCRSSSRPCPPPW